MRAFARFILRRAGWVALIGTLLAFVGAYYSVQLYKNLRTDLEELLPATARSVLDLNQVTSRLESVDNLAILVFASPEHADASRRFVDDLARELKKLPHGLIASVEYRIDQELRFFKEREALYMDLKDLERIRDYVRHRIKYETELYNPLNIFSGTEVPEPQMDFRALKMKYENRGGAYERFPDGYYATPKEDIRVVLAYLPGKTSSIDQVHRLKTAVEQVIAKLDPKSYAPDLVIRYTGGVQDTIEEHASLIADLELSTVVVMVLVSLAMLLFYRNVRATLALLTSLFMGVFATFGVSYFAVGYLNANSAFLGSIVIGNGINFGIIVLARYLEERRKDKSYARSLMISLCKTSTATWTAALAAGLSYGSLVLTNFRGFRQFGVIGLIGMILCWVSAFTLLPAYLTLLEKISPLVKKGSRPPRDLIAGGVAAFVGRFYRWIWAAAVMATVISLSMATRYNSAILETNLAKLRNKESIEHGSAYLSRYVDQIFQRYLSPLVILPHSRADALRIAAILKEEKAREGKDSLLASVQTLDDFIPKDQEKKIQVLKEIQHELPPRTMKRLTPEDRARAERLLTPQAFKPVHTEDLPQLVLGKFTEKDDSIGKLVLVEPPLNNATWDGEALIHFIHELRASADSVEPGTAIAGATAIVSDMIAAISHDGPKATLFAFLAVTVLVVLLFREPRTIVQVLFALFLGVIWLGGVILGFHLKINFLNFIALPITFGIGVDYGVNVFQRYREEGGKHILEVVRNTGGAVGLSSFTTITGYSSLLIAGNQGFVSFGTLAVAGELTCVIAAVIALPAFLLWREKRKLRGKRIGEEAAGLPAT